MNRHPQDLDYLAARIHGRRSLIAEAERLEALCRLRSLDELARAVLPAGEPMETLEFQRRMAMEWLEEMKELACGLSPPRARMLEALSERLEVEDQKRLIRGREGNSFIQECALDRDYFQGLLSAMRGLDGTDRARIRALIHHEVDHFHLMLVVRGHFFHGLGAEVLLPWHIEGTGITRGIFMSMLTAADLRQAATLALHLALDTLPSEGLEAAMLETLAWSRFLHLARRTFRQGSMEFGALVGYAALRRVEVANLITLSEGIRLGVASDALRARMEAAHA